LSRRLCIVVTSLTLSPEQSPSQRSHARSFKLVEQGINALSCREDCDHIEKRAVRLPEKAIKSPRGASLSRDVTSQLQGSTQVAYISIDTQQNTTET
jgi:hypothetical protein